MSARRVVHYERVPIKRRYQQGGDVEERPVLVLGRSAPEPAADYDYAAAERAGVQPDERGHMPDTYKLPNHITFSDESLYHVGENEGGHWSQLADDRWSFTPGPTNLKYHSMQEMRDYFKKHEPDAVFMPGQQYREGGAAQADDALTDEDRAALVNWWHGLIEDRAHGGKLHYSQPLIRGQSPRGSYRLGRETVDKLGNGDPKAGGFVVHQMFGVEDSPEDPTVVHGHVVRLLGGGDLAKGHKILQRFERFVQRRQGAQPHIEQPDNHSPDRTVTR
jgi:hypothetical protein